MPNTTLENNDDEIDLKTVVDFVKRQFKLMSLTFIAILIIAIAYALSKPTLYQSNVSLVIGERMYFLQQQQQQQLIENIDEIKYSLKDISVTQIKNTRIVELQATNESADVAQQSINLAVDKLIRNHNDLLIKKKSEFIELFKSISSSAVNKTELINLLDNASNSNKTRITSSVSTTTLRYSGRFTQITGIGFIIALISALVFGLTKDWIDKSKEDLFAKAIKPTNI
jgi:uncharacterized protein involved in exopolysaccharide biosynthesis